MAIAKGIRQLIAIAFKIENYCNRPNWKSAIIKRAIKKTCQKTVIKRRLRAINLLGAKEKSLILWQKN